MASKAELAILLKAVDQASPVLNKAGGALGTFGKAAGTAAKAAAAAGVVAGAALAGLAATSVSAASDVSESLNKVDVVFGDSADAVKKFAKTAARDLGQSRGAALAATGAFGNLFVSMGLGQKESAKLSTEIVTLGSDLASFNNIDPTEALDKLRAGLVGETEPLRQLGVNMNAAAVEAKALELGLAGTTKELTEADKVQARYALILEQTKTAQGDFSRTSTGMANSLRIINASFKDMHAAIGERLLPAVEPLISQFADALPEAFDAALPIIDSVTATLSSLITNGIEKGRAAFDALRGVFLAFTVDAGGMGITMANLRTIFGSTVADAIEPFINAFMRAVPTIKQFATDVATSAQSVAGWLRDRLGNAVQWLSDTAWPALQRAAGDIARFFQAEVIPVVSRVWDWLSPRLGSALQWLSDTAWPALQRAAGEVSAFFSREVIPRLTEVRNWLNDRVGGALTWLSETAWPWLQEAAGKVAGFLKSEVIPRLIEVRNWLQQQVGTALTWLSETAWPALQGAAAEVSRFFQSEVIPRLTEVRNWLEQQVGGALAFLADEAFPQAQAAGSNFLKSLEGLPPIIEQIQQRAKDRGAWDVLQKAWDDLRAAGGALNDILNSFVGAADDSKGAGLDLGKVLGGAVIEAFLGAANQAGNLASNIRKVAKAARDAIVAFNEWQLKNPGPQLGSLVQSGVQAAQGLVQGMTGQQPAVRSAGAQMGNAAAEGVRHALDIDSPSKVFRELGEDMGAGLVLGWLSTGGDLQKAIRDQLGMATGDAKKDAQEMARTVANALDAATGALFDFERESSQLKSKLDFDLTRVGERMGEQINAAIMDASKAIGDAQRQFEQAMADMESRRALDANIASRRAALEAELAPQIAATREVFEAKRREFRESRQLDELQHRLAQDLAKAKTDEEKTQAQARFAEAKAEFERQKKLAETERSEMARIAAQEAAELAKYEAQRRQLEETLAQEAYQREIARITAERDARITSINEALDAKKTAIFAAAEEETAKLKAEYEQRIKDLQAEVVERIPDLTGQADETIVTFLEGVQSNIGGMAAEAIADAGRIQQAIANVISAAQSAAQAVRDIPSIEGIGSLVEGRAHGGPLLPGRSYLFEGHPEIIRMGGTGGFAAPVVAAGGSGGINEDRLAGKIAAALSGVTLVVGVDDVHSGLLRKKTRNGTLGF